MKLFLIYLLLINAAAFLLMHLDKYRAKNNLWRIPERVLLSVAFCGGSLGSLLGMYTARHKTKHWKFRLLLPLFFVLQGVALFFMIQYSAVC